MADLSTIKKSNNPMKKCFKITIYALILLTIYEVNICQDLSPVKKMIPIKLNAPQLEKGISVMKALKNRITDRNISEKALTLQQLSEVLWAADGINRKDGKRTAPAAMGIYAVDIYVVLQEGIYLYDVKDHALNPIAEGDFRRTAGMQEFVYTAPLNLVYIINIPNSANNRMTASEDQKKTWAQYEVGFIVQNVYLYCASAGLGTTVRAFVDREKFSEIIKVKPDQIALAQTVGFPK
jgi:SagB-type dehydrogenase family enzyme